MHLLKKKKTLVPLRMYKMQMEARDIEFNNDTHTHARASITQQRRIKIEIAKRGRALDKYYLSHFFRASSGELL